MWVKKIRQLIQDTYFGTSKAGASLPSLTVPGSQSSNRSSKYNTSQRSSRDFDDAGSLDGSIENLERGSLTSFGSGGTADSEGQQHRVSKEAACREAGDSLDQREESGTSQNTVAVDNLQRLVDETLKLSKS